MGLLERVSTLIRANLNDMIDRAEDPEKMIKQVILDMENQYLQVKTQVAVSIADQHMLEKKLREQEDTGKDWMRKAEVAVDKAPKAQVALGDSSNSASFDRLKERVIHTEAAASAEVELINDDVAEKLNRLDRDAE